MAIVELEVLVGSLAMVSADRKDNGPVANTRTSREPVNSDPYRRIHHILIYRRSCSVFLRDSCIWKHRTGGQTFGAIIGKEGDLYDRL